MRHMLGWTTFAGATAAVAIGCSDTTASNGPVPLTLETVASGLDFPLYLTAPAGDSRLFVVEKTGRIRIIKDGTLLPAAFLDLSGTVSGGGEQGLLGLAFDPNYASNGRFIVDYTNLQGDTRVSAYKVSSDPDLADAASGDTILKVAQPFANHNGGQVAYGPDGYLYIGLGDGGSGGDPQGNGQNVNTLLAKILRIDPAGAKPYAIPSDNPFAGRTDARPEIWSYGLRNPWRFSFDRQTGDLYIGDVGQDSFEEIDVATAAAGGGKGLDYGWNVMEGTHCYGASSCDRSGLTLPLLDYDHSNGQCAVTGGFVYRGAAIPALQGTYFYADYCSGWVRSFKLSGNQAAGTSQWDALKPGGSIPSFGQDAAGELYILSADKVLRIISKP
jgi:glucose/arabinose dehydrogenase